jgi:hypothetical protein
MPPMTIIRVQSARQFRDAPSLGKWDIYSSAYFETTDTAPGAAVRGLITRLFLGHDRDEATLVLRTNAIQTGVTASTITAWRWVSGALVNAGSWSQEVYASDAGGGDQNRYLPSQCSIAVGYRADVEGPRQRGRSRFWLGPVVSNSTYVINTPGGARLSSSGCNLIASNALDCLEALQAQGWTLVVKSGPLTEATFSSAIELYVDDVIDVMRSRRTWQINQARLDIT